MADVTVPFSPISPYDFEKKLSAAECQDRQKKTTTFELDKLLRSEELLRWKAEALNASSVPLSRMLLLGFSTCILVLLLALATSRMQIGSSTLRHRSAGSLSNEEAHSADHQQLLEASMVAEQLATELQAREEALQIQSDELIHLQETLWSAEDALRDMHLKSLEDKQREIFKEAGNSSSMTVQADGQLGKLAPQLKLLAISSGLGTALCLLGFLVLKWGSHKRGLTAHRQAATLQRKLAAANNAQAKAEEHISRVQESMAEKVAELKLADLGRHHAEKQVLDLQQRYLTLQAPGPNASPSATQQLDLEKENLLAELARLQGAVIERDAELLNLNQELSELSERLPREIQDREEAVEKVRQWLDESQLQLQHSQEELNSREQECRLLKEKLEDQQHAEARMKEALYIAQVREEEMKKECHLLRGEAKAKVDSIMELMKSQRLKLSQKFLQSQKQSDKLRIALAEARQSPNQGASPSFGTPSTPGYPHATFLSGGKGSTSRGAENKQPSPLSRSSVKTDLFAGKEHMNVRTTPTQVQ